MFEIANGPATVRCSISRAALDEIGEMRCLRTADLLACFHLYRSRIEAIALTKARARPVGTAGRLNVWATDVNELPPAGVPGALRLELSRMPA